MFLFFLEPLIYSYGGVDRVVIVLVVCGAAVLLSPVWTEIAEHATLANLLEVVSSNREYLGKVVTVLTAVAERAPSHAEFLCQPIASFYSFGDRFVKYTLPRQKQSLLWSPGSIHLYSDMGWYKA